MARLLSLNAGTPKNVPWQGRTVHMGIFKHPVDGPRMVRRLNIDGDGQGGPQLPREARCALGAEPGSPIFGCLRLSPDGIVRLNQVSAAWRRG
jgi:hypothetical protein